MGFFVSGGRFESLLQRNMKLMLVFGLLFAACFTGVGKAEAAAGSDLIIVNKKTNKLAYFSDGKLVKTFPVATGKSKELTPEGSFKMVVKVKNRPYYKEKIPGVIRQSTWRPLARARSERNLWYHICDSRQ